MKAPFCSRPAKRHARARKVAFSEKRAARHVSQPGDLPRTGRLSARCFQSLDDKLGAYCKKINRSRCQVIAVAVKAFIALPAPNPFPRA